MSQPALKLTPEAINKLRNALPTLPEQEKRHLFDLLKTYNTEKTKELGKNSFLDFIMHVYPGYKIGPHHRKLSQIFEEIAEGKKKRVIVNIAPRFGKSEMISYLAPAWYLGKFPQKKIIMSSHTADLAVNFGRRVRNLVGSDLYKDIFPQVELQADSKSASRWGTNFNGEYFAIGVGGALAGRGADLFIIDDPHSEQEAKQGRADVFLPAWEWFQSGPIQRLMPGGAIIIVMCMTGDTPVLMAGGEEKRLDQIKVGDQVATYKNGKLTTSRVSNWQLSGRDPCLKITMTSGRVLRANEKHPFLVDDNGELKWIKTKYLQSTHHIVCVKDSGVSGRVKYVTTKDVQSQLKSRDSVFPTTIKSGGHLDIGEFLTPLQIGVTHVLRAATELPRKILTNFFKVKMAFVQCVASLLPERIPAPTGVTSYVSITNTLLGELGDYCATTAILQSDTQKQQKQLTLWLDTSDFTTEKIEGVVPCGVEEVFDIEVEHTGNFIANGFVSHNTRWSKLDLTGQVLDHMNNNDDADEWEVVEFPAILNEKSLWPEFWPIEELWAKKASMDPRYWMAQYMQEPTSEEGALIKREWWRVWEKDDPPPCEFVIMALDSAQETNNRADYNALTTWGVFLDPETDNYNIILLNSIKQRLEFPELKTMVYEEYKQWTPDSFIVEKKNSGSALYQEMRRTGLPVSEFTPGRGNDKISRVNAISDLFQSGIVWAPDRRWAREVIEECNDFPSGKNDDLVDSTTLALMRFRQGGFIRIPSDEKDPVKMFKSRRRVAYY